MKMNKEILPGTKKYWTNIYSLLSIVVSLTETVVLLYSFYWRKDK